ncbi:conserved Plasmodium protein, unknown function [Plasmodium knowlesi strain H]|uniref:RNA-editing substrate-binding complex 8 protein HEAT repeats domain-containing protein n=3 Tax=Plasmodium knowlesi TaxID=5850 RepID=A0A5K1V8N6_PLAKH|nr:heptatricopeptide repeat-containing protein, putative [Plasmodium knowlesi strain H]OTN63749.1 Uncharacterized protein PKNOH_S140258700 [Plasmodium knowlesi]CAA9991002.1 heptatricopeptide repeat-containing protein, putative [Plasmodium knowlesi strain H]SBO20734.1 conserved Plasmodium protein, unknown function [Plasmodium knowlesi strain H]SBO21180.1 conserved Plasmodium protein, unknown function [Plasmodium knowlesi strain H]VVS80476.1 heptatricopeptide repeat-containing protein, putative |eukprot:XP_002262285.1 hypothetical protein, conserved in Plasmodium species [Plasmodium knowlesi strain H]
MKNKRRGLKEQPRKKPLDIEKKIRNPHKYEEKMHFDNLTKGELYVPESCKAKKLAMLCNRLFYFDINDEELLDRYAQRAIVIVNSMSTKEISLILNTMRKYNHRNEKLLEAFAKHIPRKLHKGVPQDISLILNAYAHFNFIDNNLFSRICEEIPHKITYFQPFHISSVVNAFYKLKIKDRIIIDDLVDETIERIEEFDAKSLTNIINSFSKLNYQNENKKILWVKFIQGVKNLRKDFNLLEITLITNAFCKRKFKNENVYHLLSEILTSHIFEMKSVNDSNSFLLCTIAHAFAKVKFYDKDLFHFIFSHFTNEDNYASLDSQHFAQLIYSCAVFKHDDKLFLDTYTNMVRKRLEGKSNELNEQALSTIAYAYAKLRIRDVNFFVQLSSYIIKEKICLSPQSLSLICYSFSKLKIKSQMLFYFLSMQIFQNMNLFSKQGLSLILSAYANLQIFHMKMFSLINKYLNLYVENFTQEECVLISGHYQHALKCINDEVEGVGHNTDRLGSSPSSLIATSNMKKELENFIHLLSDKIEQFKREKEQRKGKEPTASYQQDDFTSNEGDDDACDDDNDEDNFFSIFNQNDIMNEDSADVANHSGQIPNGVEELHLGITPNQLTTNKATFDEAERQLYYPEDPFNEQSDHIQDMKKKEEDALKIYKKMFLMDVEGTTSTKGKRLLINEKLNERLRTILSKQDITTEDENTKDITTGDENRKGDRQRMEKTTKSLLQLMTSNKPPKINYEKENFIKSAEQVESEFIKAYVSEQQEQCDDDKDGSTERRKGRRGRKKQIQNMLSRKYQPADDLPTLQKKWNDLYNPSP